MGLRGPILRLSDRSILGENGTNIGFNYFLDEVPLDSHETRSISLLQLLLEGCKNRLQMLFFFWLFWAPKEMKIKFFDNCAIWAPKEVKYYSKLRVFVIFSKVSTSVLVYIVIGAAFKGVFNMGPIFM